MAGSDPLLSPLFGAKTPYGVLGRSRPRCITPVFSWGRQVCHPQSAGTSCQTVSMISATSEDFQHSSSMLSQFPSLARRDRTDAFLPSSNVAPVPSLVKALDRYAAHVRAAMTSLGARMQKTFRYEGMPQSVRSPNRSDAYLRVLLSKTQPLRGPRTTTSSFGTETVKLPQPSLWRRPAHRLLSSLRCLSTSIWQEASQAAKFSSGWTGHELRFRLPLVLCFIEALQATRPKRTPDVTAFRTSAGSLAGGRMGRYLLARTCEIVKRNNCGFPAHGIGRGKRNSCR